MRVSALYSLRRCSWSTFLSERLPTVIPLRLMFLHMSGNVTMYGKNAVLAKVWFWDTMLSFCNINAPSCEPHCQQERKSDEKLLLYALSFFAAPLVGLQWESGPHHILLGPWRLSRCSCKDIPDSQYSVFINYCMYAVMSHLVHAGRSGANPNSLCMSEWSRSGMLRRHSTHTCQCTYA